MEHNIEIFNSQGYCIVKSAIPELLRDFITQYALFDEMQDYSPEDQIAQVPGTHSKYADPAMESLLLILKDTIEENTGLKVEPTYSYYRVYREGDDLKIHTDRPSCEISCTLCFNYEYGNSEYKWPIFMNGKPVILEPGDLIIYRGCDLEHWRDSLETKNEESWHVQGFFHYVDVQGPYIDYKYDQRNTVGELKKKKSTQLLEKNYIEYTEVSK